MLKNDHFFKFFRKKGSDTHPLRCYMCIKTWHEAFVTSLDAFYAEYMDAIPDLSKSSANPAILWKIAYEAKMA